MEDNTGLDSKTQKLLAAIHPDLTTAGKPKKKKSKNAKEGGSIKTFRSNMTLAVRTSTMCLLCALPILSPTLYRWLCDPDWTNKATCRNPVTGAWLSYIPGGIILMIIFTVYQNVGSTIQLAYQGAIGTFWACLYSHVISALMPYGAWACAEEQFHLNITAVWPKGPPGECKYNPIVVNVTNCLFIFCALWFNLTKNVRTFILSYHVYFIMAIQTPTADPLMNISWAVKMSAQTTITMGTALFGVLAAVWVTWYWGFGPVTTDPDDAKKGDVSAMNWYWGCAPITATAAAKHAAILTTEEAEKVLREVKDYFMRESASVSITSLETQCLQLRTDVNSMVDTVDTAWWEYFDMGKQGMKRQYLTAHAKVLKQQVDNIFAMQIAVAKEDFGASHKVVMKKMKDSIEDLLRTTWELQDLNVQSAADGLIGEKEREKLQEGQSKVREAIEKMSTEFNKLRQDKELFRGAEPIPINKELQSEAFFFYCLCVHGKLTIGLTDEFLEPKYRISIRSVLLEMKSEWASSFAPSTLWERLNWNSFTVRSTVQILTAYYVGLWCLDYDAKAAGTIALLLNEFMGSAMLKNLNRLQSVVLAAVIPHLMVKALTTQCDPFLVCLKCFAFLAWEILTTYIYYASPSYGYIGMLLAAFSASTLVYPCQPKESFTQEMAAKAEATYEVGQYSKIYTTTLAVLIMVIVDRILSTGEACTKAKTKILQTYISLDCWFQAGFIERENNGALTQDVNEELAEKVEHKDWFKDTLRAAISEEVKEGIETQAMINGKRLGKIIHPLLADAETLGDEADKEPRYWKVVWPLPFFQAITRTAHILRANLGMVEQVLEGDGNSTEPMPYEDIFKEVRVMPEFQDLSDHIYGRMTDTTEMIKLILQNEAGKSEMEDRSISKRALAVEAAGRREVAFNKMFTVLDEKKVFKFPAKDKPVQTLEKDVICRVNVVLMLMEACMDEVHYARCECLKMEG
jgi:hypothetical protein